MKRIALLREWIQKAFPIAIIILVVIIHILICVFVKNSVFVMELFGKALVILGGIVVLISINEDYKKYRNRSMLSAFMEYLKSCPIFKQNHVLNAESGIYAMLTGKVHGFVTHSWSTPDEGFKELERRINELREFTIGVSKATNDDISHLRSELNISYGENKQLIEQVRNLLENKIFDDAKLQFLGVLLVLYGVFVDIILLFNK